MRNLLAIWRAHELDALLREAWERGIVLAGLSAGAMCWFEGGHHALERAAGDDRRARAAARLADASTPTASRSGCPSTSTRSAAARCPGGWAADDGVGLLFADTRSARVGLLAAGRRGAARRRGRRASWCARGSSPSCSARGRRPMPPPGDAVEELRALRRLRGRVATGRVRTRSHRKGAQVR